MQRITEIIETPLPQNEAFDIVADFAQIAEWDPSVVSCSAVDDSEIGVGKRYKIHVTFAGQRIRMAYAIVEYDHPMRLVLKGISRTNAVVDTIQFESIEHATRITWHLDLSLRGALSVINPVVYPFLRGSLQRLGERAMDGLAQHLGGRRITQSQAR